MRKRAPAVRSALDRRIEVHDRHQFELKLEYQPSEETRQSRYIVEAFVCVPGSLNVSRETVHPEELYADIHNYVRLKTPELAFSEMGALAESPLAQLERSLAAVERGEDPAHFIYAGKMFACVFRGALRHLVERTDEVLRHARVGLGPAGAGHAALDPQAMSRVIHDIRETLGGAESSLKSFRGLAKRALAPARVERVRVAFKLCDEYTSLSIEHMIRRIIVTLARLAIAGDAALEALKQELFETILGEEGYRRAQGYPTIIDPRSDNEPYIYRSGLLKKYCSSALFLKIHRQGARRRMQELLFAISAGIAMAFATVVAFWAQSRFSKFGLQLFVMLVIGYMFKDRIKESSRGAFSRLLEKTLYDRKITIDDPAGGILGVCREKMEYLSAEELPADVRDIRRTGVDPSARVAEEELTEAIIHYKKEIVLSSPAVSLRGAGAGAGLTDILRFQVGRLLHNMDEPDQEIEYIDLNTRALEAIKAVKTYHVDVVFRFQTRERAQPQTTLMRLILDRNGIKRIERLEAAKAATAAASSDAPPNSAAG